VEKGWTVMMRQPHSQAALELPSTVNAAAASRQPFTPIYGTALRCNEHLVLDSEERAVAAF
jgi:hypothetical protein